MAVRDETHTEHDDCGRRVARALREMPREQAAAGFTAAVLARLDAPVPPAASLPGSRWVMAAAALALAVTAAGAGLWMNERERSSRLDAAEARQVLEQIRSEHARLASELESLRRTDAAEPVLYLGDDEEVDLVLDLREVPDLRGVRQARRARNDGAL